MHVQSKAQKYTGLAMHYFFMGALAIYFVFPMLFMFISSFKTPLGITSSLGSIEMILPTSPTLENYSYVLGNPTSGFWVYIFNSIVVTTFTVAMAVIVDSLIAFSLCRLRFKGQKIILLGIIALMIIPFEAIAVPMLMLVSKLPYVNISALWSDGELLKQGWINTRFVQMLPFVARAFPIFLFYQFFRDIPKDFDEAAYIDGATPWQVWWRLVMPMSGPVIATVIILEFLFVWNQYLWPVLVAYDPSVSTVQLGLGIFFSAEGAQYGRIMAYSSLITLPVLLVFLSFQKFFVRSVMGAGVKG